MQITIRAIAEMAQVSRGTVDKVLNDRTGVSPEVREKVRRIAEEMGYKPNIAGKALAYQKKPLRIGFLILNGRDPFFREVLAGAQKAWQEFRDFGLHVEFAVADSLDPTEQVHCIRQLYASGISALAVSPLDEDIVRVDLNRLTQENLRLITYNTDMPDVERLCFVGQNLKQSGRVAGQLLGLLLPPDSEAAVLTGPLNIKALKDRIEGFNEILRESYPTITFADTIQNITDDEDSYRAVKKLLTEHKNLKAIYLTSRGTEGVGRALQELQRTDLKFICHDTLAGTLDLLKNGTVDFTITQEPFMQGYLPVKLFFEYFFHNRLPEQEHYYTRLEIKTRENIDG